MEFITILCIILTVVSFIYVWKSKNEIIERNAETEQYNNKLKEEHIALETMRAELLNSNQNLKQTNEDLLKKEKILTEELNQLIQQQQNLDRAVLAKTIKNNSLQEQYVTLKQTIDNSMRDQRELAHNAFMSYCEVLDEEYFKSEAAYDELQQILKDAYERNQDELQAKFLKQKEEIARDLAQCQQELEKVRATKTAALEAQHREEQIKNQRAFYSLTVDGKNEKDILILKEVKDRLNDCRPLLMAMWSAYYLKPANDLAARILGGAQKTGIYKITQADLGLCYIGQARDIRERWRDHMKHGLGIDTPAGNKLYADMNKYGLEAFTFELLEECPAAELNEKEKYYIDLYSSYEFGYNSNKGIGK